MSSQISFMRAKNLIIERLEQDKSQLPASEWNKKRYILDTWRSLSINELINEVKTGTPLGRQYVIDEATKLGYTVIG